MKQIYKDEFVNYANDELKEEVEKLKTETKMSQRERLHSLFTVYGKCLFIGCSL